MYLLKKIPGPFLVFLGACSLSFGGLIVKSFEGATLWQILFWRSLFFILIIIIFLLLTYKKKVLVAFKKSGLPGFIGGIVLSSGFCGYVFAMYNTTVANTNFIIQTQILFLAVFGSIFLKEKISKITFLSIILAIIGVVLMVGSTLSPGQTSGNLAAFIMPISFAILILIIRKYPNVDMIPLQFIAGIIAMSVGYFIAGKINISSHDILLGFLAGFFSTRIRFYIYHNRCKKHSLSDCRNNYDNRGCIRSTMGMDVCWGKSTFNSFNWRLYNYFSSFITVFV